MAAAQRRWGKTTHRAEKLLREREDESGQPDVFTLSDEQLTLLRELLFEELHEAAGMLAEKASVAAEGASDSPLAAVDAEGLCRLRLRTAAGLLDILGWCERVESGGE